MCEYSTTGVSMGVAMVKCGSAADKVCGRGNEVREVGSL